MPEQRTGRRFPLTLPIEVRSEGEVASEGVTENLSAAAVYLRTASELEAGSPVEFEIRLPQEAIASAEKVLIRCKGHVVRREDPEADGVRGVACVIDSYEFVRGGERG